MERVLRLTTKNAGVSPRILEVESEAETTSGLYRRYSRSIIDKDTGKAKLKGRYNYLGFTKVGMGKGDNQAAPNIPHTSPSFIFAHELGH